MNELASSTVTAPEITFAFDGDLFTSDRGIKIEDAFKKCLHQMKSIFRGSDQQAAEIADIILSNWQLEEGWTKNALEELEDIYDECFTAGWDGYDAHPISQEAYIEACKFIRSVRTSLPMPEITPEPDGGIGFEWYLDNHLSFIASVLGESVIYYSGLFGDNNKVHGTENFTRSIPDSINDFLNRLFAVPEI